MLHLGTVDLVATYEKSTSADDDKKKTEPSTSQNFLNHVECERQEISAAESGLTTSGLLGRMSTTDVGLSACQVFASLTEIAKEFVHSRTLRVSPTTLGLRSQTLREDSSFQSILPFKTPRSAIYNMARSPYMKAHSAAALGMGDLQRYLHGQVTCFSGGKQA
ncbi:hypothetical protein H6P81_016591 [Aristolochia fimbriata]|uniref:Uncharacterized protein n=1 Tax=Aristolochia fimbriata TaxID=158543 RepID=A0AAV7EA08_ARIFI|nr:hypothetical protein H6P81_016591 [Aristolochia fimbriata]